MNSDFENPKDFTGKKMRRDILFTIYQIGINFFYIEFIDQDH